VTLSTRRALTKSDDPAPAKGVTLFAASAPTHFVEDTPTAILVRQVFGAIAEFEKATIVASSRRRAALWLLAKPNCA
jgi:DNA invertase Pin-like site-specific DNA recombinase